MTIHLLGTSHISQQSINQIKHAIEHLSPTLIAVELDQARAKSLLSGQKNKVSTSLIPLIGLKGYLFAKLGQIVQQKLGASVGISPGEEMKTAILEAQRLNLKVALIDQPIQTTLKNFSKTLTWREKGRFLADAVKGLIAPKRQIKKFGLEGLDLTKVPPAHLIEKLMAPLKIRYPSIYKTLVHDRNKYMAKNLKKIQVAHPDAVILAVVGAGHIKGMHELLLRENKKNTTSKE